MVALSISTVILNLICRCTTFQLVLINSGQLPLLFPLSAVTAWHSGLPQALPGSPTFPSSQDTSLA